MHVEISGLLGFFYCSPLCFLPTGFVFLASRSSKLLQVIEVFLWYMMSSTAQISENRQ